MSEKNTVTVRGVEIGSGIPKICIPLTGINMEEILSEAEQAKASGADLVEWRADWYGDISDAGRTGRLLESLRGVLGSLPLLFTFRTRAEGGERELSSELYMKLNRQAICSGCVDLVDVELSAGDNAVRSAVKTAHASGVKVICSSHDFQGTPPKEEMISRLCRMQELGADILKIAVMPQNAGDVLTLLGVTDEMRSEYARCPVVTMAMGEIGVVSRISGEIFGSAITFGTAGRASAPGQICAGELREILECLHRNL